MRRHFETLGSTNDAARDWARDGAPHLSVVTSAQQTAGRGRRGRAWASPARCGLYVSLILRPECGMDAVPQLSMLLALAACRAVDELTGLRANVKWPNDVLLNNRKIAGVLCEAELRRDDVKSDVNSIEFCVCGLGLNLNNSRDELPPRAIFPASSLKLETGREFDFELALSAVLREFEILEHSWRNGEWERLRLAWEARCFGLGREVVVRNSHGDGHLETAWRGVALMTDASGALLIGTTGGVRRVLAGDVSFVT